MASTVTQKTGWFIADGFTGMTDTGTDQGGKVDDFDDDNKSGGNSKGTQTKEFTPPASQADLDRIIEARLSRERSRFADYDSLKEKATQFDRLSAASQTDLERAASEARETARRETLAAAVPRLVRAEFKAAAKGVLDQDQLEALLEDLDLMKYADKDGQVDEDRVARKVAALAPKKGDDDDKKFPDLGGGRRGGTSLSTSMNDIIRGKAS